MAKLWRNLQYVNNQPDISINFIDFDSSPMQKYDKTKRQNDTGVWVTVHYADTYSEYDFPGEVMSVVSLRSCFSKILIIGVVQQRTRKPLLIK